MSVNDDSKTAKAFSTSWNTLPQGSVYTKAQYEEWMSPLTSNDITSKRVLELGCGNGSLLVHTASWNPQYLEGVDLGDSVISAKNNMAMTGHKNWTVIKSDLVKYSTNGFDVVYCIGVLHHLKEPEKGFEAVVRNVKSGGKFHCWVYAREGNAVIIYLVDPLRKVVSKFPWWITKYLIASPLAFPFFLYAKTLFSLKKIKILRKLPLFDYCQWIATREFSFFRHVTFDQLVTPQTTYINRNTVAQWLTSSSAVDQSSTYIIMRNGNSWKFGGTVN
jgi:SAM-dependent methyltransferase